LRILIADDDAVSRIMVAAVLKKCGYDVVAVADGVAALEAMQGDDAPPLAILDWMMPGMDGPEVCRRVRAIDTDQPPYILMLTMRETKEDVVAGLDAGADDYLTKPYDATELRARVRVGKRMVELQARLADKIEELHDAFDHVKALQGIIPICSFCKKIRDDSGYWNQLETYLRFHTDATLSHSLCPDCLREHYPDQAERVEKRLAAQRAESQSKAP